MLLAFNKVHLSFNPPQALSFEIQVINCASLIIRTIPIKSILDKENVWCRFYENQPLFQAIDFDNVLYHANYRYITTHYRI